MRLIGYLRVSTDDQSVDSAGQKHAVQQWATRNGHEVVDWYVDEGVSGAKGLDRRPGLSSAFVLCQSQRRRRNGRVEGIVAFDRSRFSRDRNLSGLLRWTAHNQGFELLATDGLDTRDESFEAAASDLVSNLLSEQARRAIRRATRAALAARRDNGLVAGHTPYGYAQDGARVVPCDSEVAVITRMRGLRGCGLSLRQIARTLNDAGTLTRRGGLWSQVTVREVLMGRYVAEHAA